MPATQAPRTLRDPAALAAAGLVPAAAVPQLAAVAARYAIAVPGAMAALIDPADPADPLARQFIPDPAELIAAPGELLDPTADAPFTPIKGIVHRYPDRALLKPLLTCPVYCRFCFRREAVGPEAGLLSAAELDAAIGWVAATPAIREVILTGGDPLMLSPRRLGPLLARLAAIPHVEFLRIHSRVPVAVPHLVTPDLAEALRLQKPLFVCVHANHAREFLGGAEAAIGRLRGAGAILLGQSVLLRGVNDSVSALEDLFRAMLRQGIKPYYLHQLDPAPGTARFAVSEAEGLALVGALRGRLSGLGQPSYVRETPGGGGKVVVGRSNAETA